LAQKLRTAVATPLQVGKDSVQVSASIGIARHPEDGTDGDTLLAAADAAMYSAKRKGAGHAFASRSKSG
jgi:diguanylate cyclase (GGDEF)-like protein